MIITNTQEYMIFIDFRLLLFIQLGIKKEKNARNLDIIG